MNDRDDCALAPPLLTATLPGIGGRIKQLPEDFEVEEVPAYPPCGQGDFLYLWVQKRGMGADFFLRQLARRLNIPTADIGTAGIKDRHAVTRQMVSVPARVKDRLEMVSGDGIELLQVASHTNKLKPGHLRGNRFRVLIRQAEAVEHLPTIVAQLRQSGLPNYYGPQRFGRGGETLALGWALVEQKRGGAAAAVGQRRLPRTPFLRRLALSAVQSALFNHYLAQRLRDGLLHRVLPGDVMSKWPAGGLFRADDLDREQARFNARETVTTGPIFGRKMFAATGEAAAREARVLADVGLVPADFAGFGKLLLGTRRHNLVYLDDLSAEVEPDGVRLTFTLPAGSYATVLLREVMKGDVGEAAEAD
jgi:tRNA pseudouridine13 synthase